MMGNRLRVIGLLVFLFAALGMAEPASAQPVEREPALGHVSPPDVNGGVVFGPAGVEVWIGGTWGHADRYPSERGRRAGYYHDDPYYADACRYGGDPYGGGRYSDAREWERERRKHEREREKECREHQREREKDLREHERERLKAYREDMREREKAIREYERERSQRLRELERERDQRLRERRRDGRGR